MSEWLDIATAPKDGTVILGRLSYAERYTGKLRYHTRKTRWGKTSHVPLYGWTFGRGPEDQDIWAPSHWKPVWKASK